MEIPLHAGYSIPSFDSARSIEGPVKVKPLGKNLFTRYETPMVPDEHMEWQESKLAAKPQSKQAITGDYAVPPEPDE